MLAALDATGQALAAGDWIIAAQQLFQARHMLGGPGRKTVQRKTAGGAENSLRPAHLTLAGQQKCRTLLQTPQSRLYSSGPAAITSGFRSPPGAYQASLRQRQALVSMTWKQGSPPAG
jgi:hypothetical protein